MRDIHTEQLFEEFVLYFPSISKYVVDYYSISPNRLVICEDNGDRRIYNSRHNAVRTYMANDVTGSELEWRRRFRDCLEDILIEQGLTRKDLAYRCGVSPAAITLYMKCESTPSAYILDKIARALDCCIDDLMVYQFTKEISYV